MSFAFQRTKILREYLAKQEAESPGLKDWVIESSQDGRTGLVTKRDFSEKKRKTLADSGAAMPDGSFPIENEEDLHNAVRLAGHAKDVKAAKAHIKARAKALGASLPDSWVSKAEKDEQAKNKPDVKKAGIEVQTSDPESGVYAHTLGGKIIGHTVKAVHDGTIAWTAVPAGGSIKGKFKNHEDAKQYLADNCANNMAQEEMQNKMAAQSGKPIKKDDEEVGDDDNKESEAMTKADDPASDNMPGDSKSASSTEVEKGHSWTVYGKDGKKVPMKPEHKAKFEANKFVAKMAELKQDFEKLVGVK